MSAALRIVLVEDDAWLREYYARTLQREGYEVYEAAHGLEAIDLIDEVKPHVILLDLLLVGTTALTLLHELQTHADMAAIPVILITNAPDAMTTDDARHYGVVKIIDKTIMQPEDVIVAVRQAV